METEFPIQEVRALMALPTSELLTTLLDERVEAIFDEVRLIPGTSLEPELWQEFVKWRRVFVDKPAIVYAHTATVIMIRRKINLAESIIFFNQIWSEAGCHLVNFINTKWLLSACDTLIDYGETEADRAYALAGSLLMKTIKLYESELISRQAFQNELVAIPKQELFDGYLSFSIFQGDLIGNLKCRVENIGVESPAKLILKTLFLRANIENTVYKRLEV
jgi:hypothetical protein